MFKTIFFLVASLALSPTELRAATKQTVQPHQFHVVIDAGHGGHDGGAKRDHIKESVIVLNIAMKLKSLLDKNPKLKSTMTRHKDRFIPLSRRAHRANHTNADLYLSIHANASLDSRAKGLEVYFQNQLPPDEEAMYLANLEEQSEKKEDLRSQNLKLSSHGIDLNALPGDGGLIVEDLLRADRIKKSSQISKEIYKNWKGTRKKKSYSIRQAPFYVVSNVNMPSVLVEVGFISNKKDQKLLRTKAYQNQIAQNLYTSILNFKESIDK